MYNTAGSPPPYSWSYVEFYDYEVRDTSIYPRDYSIVKKLGTGKPKLINRSGYNRIPITFNLQSTNAVATSTLTKLKTLRDRTDDLFVLYYKRIDNSDVYRFVTFDRKQIPDDITIAGMFSGRQNITVEFIEIDKTSEIGPGEEAETILFTAKFNRFVFLYDSKYRYLLNDSLDNIWNYTEDTNQMLWAAIDYNNTCFFIGQGYYGHYLTRRSLLNGAKEAEYYDLSTDFNFLGVNRYGHLFVIDNNGENWVKLFNHNLKEYHQFDLNTTWGNSENDGINYAAITFDELYIYVTTYLNRNKIAKFAMANLDGGAEEWNIDLGNNNANRVYVCKDGHVFVVNTSSPYQIRKLSNVDGSVLWGPVTGGNYGNFLAYNENLHSLYTPYSDQKIRQIDADTGAEIGTTADSGMRTYCCAVSGDAEYLFVGCTTGISDTRIRIYDISSDWSGGETPVDSFQVNISKKYQFAADPTGYLNQMFWKYRI